MENKVFREGLKVSQNFYHSDQIFQHYIHSQFSVLALAHMNTPLEKLGEQAAKEMDTYAQNCDKKSPVLIKRDCYGNDINEIEFHPHYWKLMKIAVESQMFHVKWDPELRNRFSSEVHRLGFSAGYLYAMAESGQYCPLCMTDGVARLIDRYCKKEDQERLLPKIATLNWESLYTGAMFLTEKAGGSDVGANLVSAQKVEGNKFLLNGEKWFCSNANADLIFVLARTDENKKGTRGLSIFLVEKYLKDGTRNPMNMIRLKDKLGVRSMASAEIVLSNTQATLVGEECQGFRIMTDMINLSRIYNSMAALAASSRALVEAYQFTKHRYSFGKRLIEHALVREKLEELGALHVANFYLCWRSAKAIDLADNGDENESHLLRLITPMTKKWSAENAVYLIRECMELMGGMGYIEDTIMPRLMRDTLVLPIWEGAGNIMILDMLRSTLKSKGLETMLDLISTSFKTAEMHQKILVDSLVKLQKKYEALKGLNQNDLEVNARYFFEDLTQLFQCSLLLEHRDEISKAWIDPALQYFVNIYAGNKGTKSALNEKEIDQLIGWTIE